MSKADELKSKNENLFERNTILLNENERLKSENAELKEELKEYKNGNFVQTVNQIIEGKDKQLTKAKEIIREIMKYDIPTLDYEQAEQFLQEIEK